MLVKPTVFVLVILVTQFFLHPHVSIFVWKRRYFSLVWPTVHTYLVKTVTENASFQKRSPEWRFLKTPAFRLRVDGRKRRFLNTMMLYIICFQPDAFSITDAIVFCFFFCFVLFFFFGKRRKKNSVFKNILIRVDWALLKILILITD